MLTLVRFQGGIACGIWTMACKRTINAVKDVVVDVFAAEAVPTPEAPQPVPVPASNEAKSEEKEGPLPSRDEL